MVFLARLRLERTNENWGRCFHMDQRTLTDRLMQQTSRSVNRTQTKLSPEQRTQIELPSERFVGEVN